MKENIFRKKSISSPEAMNDYLRVTKPAMWITLTAIIVLVAGGIIWSIFGVIEKKSEAVLVVSGGEAVAYVKGNAADILQNMTVKAADCSGIVTSISDSPTQGRDIDEYALYIGGFGETEWLSAVSVEIAIPDGTYKAEIVTDSLSPLSLFLA